MHKGAGDAKSKKFTWVGRALTIIDTIDTLTSQSPQLKTVQQVHDYHVYQILSIYNEQSSRIKLLAFNMTVNWKLQIDCLDLNQSLILKRELGS